jgi:hypothetical protein
MSAFFGTSATTGRKVKRQLQEKFDTAQIEVFASALARGI